MTSYLVLAICRVEVAVGFCLSGVPPVVVASSEAAYQQLQLACRNPRVGVVFLEECFYQTLPGRVSAWLSRLPLPVVVPFPGPTWVSRSEEAERYVVDLLRQVIGYRVRLQ